MPVLVPNRPVRTDEPLLLVENRLEPGTHLFRLVVVNDAGVESAPVEREVTVLPRTIVPPIGPPIEPPIDRPVGRLSDARKRPRRGGGDDGHA